MKIHAPKVEFLFVPLEKLIFCYVHGILLAAPETSFKGLYLPQ